MIINFNNNESLNHNSIKSNIKLSSDLYYQNLSSITPRLKFIIPVQLKIQIKVLMKKVSQ